MLQFMKALGQGVGTRVPGISPVEARAMLDRGEAIAVDVRSAGEVAATGRIPGALVIPHSTIALHAGSQGPDSATQLDRHKTIIAYCASGARSALAGRTLKELGFDKVYNLGSIRDWVAAGMPVER